jgi:two-component system, cell cycle sensor histidine kinase and response regulator CckA
VRLELNIAPDLAPVKADATQILQVLMNLCVNSRDALPAGGLIVLTADNVTLGSTQTAAFPGTKPGEHVRIRVRDNGTGIPAEVLDKIFEPFFTTKDVGKGTGLGLSTALGIVQEHAGIIELESTGQQGTTFVIYLPATTETPTIKTTLSNLTTTGTATPRSAAPSTTSGKGVTVLVVDDEAPLRQAVSLILGQRGYKVLEAPDGAKAIEMVRELGSEVDVVLLDVMMPRMDGVATLKALREVRNNLRVIATSGVNHDSRVEAMRKLGVQHFLLKPYRNQDLVDALEECLSSKSGV